MQEQVNQIKLAIEHAHLQKLTKSFDESECHAEYDIFKENLSKSFEKIRISLNNIDLTNSAVIQSDLISSLVILFIELLTTGPWNSDKSTELAKVLNTDFQTAYAVSLEGLFRSSGPFNVQNIFDACLDQLHSKLTLSNFKKYPALVDVYCLLVKDIKDYPVIINPLKTLPISLILIDDFNVSSKIKGMSCCKHILQCMSQSHLSNGNYHEVIYAVLHNALKEKKLSITKLLCDCLVEFIRLIPTDQKADKLDELFFETLEETYLESNFSRKAILFNFLSKLISFHGVECVGKKKKFNMVIIENLNLCSNEEIRLIMIDNLIECFEEWIKHCWCLWKYSTDSKIMSVLFKILCALNTEEVAVIDKIQNLIITLVYLCNEDEQKAIDTSLNKFIHNNTNNKAIGRFKNVVEYINENIL